MRIILLILLVLVTSCSQKFNLSRHLKEKYVYDESFGGKWEYHSELNKSFQPEFTDESNREGQLIFIGASESYSFKSRGSMDRKKLINEAKQRALIKLYAKVTNNVHIRTLTRGDYMHRQVRAEARVRGIKGWSLHFNEYQCIVTKVPMPDLKYDYKRECRVIIKVPENSFLASTED